MPSDDQKLSYYIFFPYLKCSDKIIIDEITFYSSNKIDELSADDQNILREISDKFYMSYNYKIKNMMVSVIKERYDLSQFGYKSDIHTTYGKVLKIRELIIYLYSSLHPTFLDPFLDKVACNLFAFIPEKRVIPNYRSNINLQYVGGIKEELDKNLVDGYHGILNGTNFISIEKNEKILPPIPGYNQNYNQDLSVDLQRIEKGSVYNFFHDFKKVHILFETDRLFRSMQWYNRSNSKSISLEEQLINLSISFESLLDLEKDKNITNRFRNAINILIGNNEKLNAWADQFYNARSEIVHRGRTGELSFTTGSDKGDKIKYRDLTSYGRRIFQILLNTILNSEFLKYKTDLEELFISNRERIGLVIKEINKNVDILKTLKSLGTVIENIEKYKYVGEEKIYTKDLLHLISKTIEAFLSDFDDNEKNVLKDFICEKDIVEKLIKYENVNVIIEKSSLITTELKKINSFCWHYLMFSVFQAKRQKDATT